MSAERAFILGAGLAVAASLVPDIPSALAINKERPELRNVTLTCYAILAVSLFLVLWEVYG